MTIIYYLDDLEHIQCLKILILANNYIDIQYIYNYKEIITKNLFTISNKTLYIIKDIEIYKQFQKINTNSNTKTIFICQIQKTNNKNTYYYKYINEIIAEITKDTQNELQELTRKLQKSKKNHINIIYKHILKITEQKNKKYEYQKSIIQLLIQKKINFHALFNINLKIKNAKLFEDNIKKYIKYYEQDYAEYKIALELIKNTKNIKSNI